MIDGTALPPPQRLAELAARFAMLLLMAAVACDAFARDVPPLADVKLSDLPKEAQHMYALIREGGPFHYSRDGVAFGNREKLLPSKPRGYYREYTVRTPGAKDRGARRMVCGGPETAPDACFYSDDHYNSFRRIRQ